MDEWKKYKCHMCGYELAASKSKNPRCSECNSRRLIEIKQFSGVIHMTDEIAKAEQALKNGERAPEFKPKGKVELEDDDFDDDDDDDLDDDDDDEE